MKELSTFINKLNVDYGFMLFENKVIESLENRVYSVEEMVEILFEMEGLHPHSEISLFRKIKRFFIQQIGSEIKIETKL